MMTAKDIKQVSFDKTLHGYRCDDVDSYLQQVADTVDSLSADKANLEKKVQILSVQLQKYIEDEETLKTALLNAQRMGETVVHEARQNADVMLREARLKVSTIQDEVALRTQEGEIALRRLQQEVAHFKNEVLALYKQHITSLSALPDLSDDGEAVPPTEASQQNAAAEVFAPAVVPVAVPVSEPAPVPQAVPAPAPFSVNIFEDKLDRQAETTQPDEDFPFLAAKPKKAAIYDQDSDMLAEDMPAVEDAVEISDVEANAPAAPMWQTEDATPAQQEENSEENVAYKPITFGQSAFVPVHKDAKEEVALEGFPTVPDKDNTSFAAYQGMRFDD